MQDINMLSEQNQIKKVISLIETLFKNKILGIYLYGSATLGGLKPNSDIDILIILTQEIEEDEREILTEQLLNISGHIGCKDKRPLEVTVLNKKDIISWKFPLRCEYMYGEWLREEMEMKKFPQAFYDPDIIILLWQARKSNIILKGDSIEEFVSDIAFSEIKNSIQKSLPNLISNFEGDERNTLLTLSRMWFTLATKEITSKDRAAEWVLSRIPDEFKIFIKMAKEAYLGKISDEWESIKKEVFILVNFMEQHIKKL